MKYNRTITNLLFGVLCVMTVLALLRLLACLVVYGEKSLQMDFSAYYTAGESVLAGLSPYSNNYWASPPIWDGMDVFKHSRFLYPPLVAAFFCPLALLPFHAAKYVWMILNLVGVIASVLIAARISRQKVWTATVLISLLLTFIFYPLLTLLERGQIDGVTFVLLTISIYLISTRQRENFAGILLSVATLLKLHIVLVLPFLVLRKQWKTLRGYAVGVVCIGLLSVLVCGASSVGKYVDVEFPRITKYGEAGTYSMLADYSRIASLKPSAELTSKDGRIYAPESFHFVANASLVQAAIGYMEQKWLPAVRQSLSPSDVSLVLFAGFFSVMLLLQRFKIFASTGQPADEFLYWQLVLVMILLCAPLTCVMNVVWLVALIPVAVRTLSVGRPYSGMGPALVVLGLLVAGVPDHLSYGFLFSNDTLSELDSYKYVFAELILVLGLMLCLRRVPVRHDGSGTYSAGT